MWRPATCNVASSLTPLTVPSFHATHLATHYAQMIPNARGRLLASLGLSNGPSAAGARASTGIRTVLD
eukprot:3452539-Pleurochrysis_carterae.AAC.1